MNIFCKWTVKGVIWDICEEYATNWNQMLWNRQVTIVTIHNYGESYGVGGNVSFQHVGGDWWRKRRVVELYGNFYTKLSFIKRVPVEHALSFDLLHANYSI